MRGKVVENWPDTMATCIQPESLDVKSSTHIKICKVQKKPQMCQLLDLGQKCVCVCGEGEYFYSLLVPVVLWRRHVFVSREALRTDSMAPLHNPRATASSLM